MRPSNAKPQDLIHRIPIKDRNGNVIDEIDVVSYRGLLDLAHRERLSSLKTVLVQAPADQNGQTAIVHATIETTRGVFTGIGDASPSNVHPRIVPHLIRMAETRAEARALRTALNIGVVSREELESEIWESSGPAPNFASSSALQERHAPAQTAGTRESTVPTSPRPSNTSAANDNAGMARAINSSRASDSQRRYLYRLLAERGLGGDNARGFVHRELGVASLDDAGRNAVSNLIDRLKADEAYGRAA